MSKGVDERNFYKESLKLTAILVVLIFAIRFTMGGVAIAIVLTGVSAALGNKRGLALAIYLLLPFYVILNPVILPGSAILGYSARLGGVLMIFSMMIAATRSTGTQVLPLKSIGLFFYVAALSSAAGYFPTISYLKIVNCVLFLLGIFYGTRNIHHHPEDVYLLRKFFFSFAIIIILGSIATLPFPSVAYYTSIKTIVIEFGVDAAADYMQRSEGMSLFTGVVNHSQFLAPMVACLAGWLFCDMIVVERRVRWLHALMLAICPVILFMTRSRAGLFSFLVVLFMVFTYCMPKLKLSSRLNGRLQSFLMVGALVLVAGAVVMQARNASISRWLRKTEDVSGDRRSMTEAVTSSRMGKMNESMRDFKKNPLLGTGFQVIPEHRILYKMGYISLFAAPLERGFIFTAILGETGALGFIAFLIFILSFWFGCARKGYFVTWTLFVVYLSTNFAEMTFFSPGGGGGIEWLVTVVGGFVIDLAVKGKVNMQMWAMPPPQVIPTKDMA